MLVAKHHVTLGGRQYMPGEVIEEKVPADTAEWWLSVGAVEKIMDAPYREDTLPANPDVPDDSGEQEDEVDETGEQEDEVDEAGEQEDEVDEAAEPEEIDVAAGIVREAEAPAEPPAEAPVKEKRKRTRTPSKNGGKKS